MLDEALQYAARGWRVFPLHDTSSGKCSCGKACASPGKHPRTRHGVKDATTDAKQILAWWKRWPRANIGLATGSGLVVIDIDGPAGVTQLAELTSQYGKLAPTLTARTGARVSHLPQRHPRRFQEDW